MKSGISVITTVKVSVESLATVKVRITEPFDHTDPKSIELAAKKSLNKELAEIGSSVPVRDLPKVDIKVEGYCLDVEGEEENTEPMSLTEISRLYGETNN
jgi:hypothetical protein